MTDLGSEQRAQKPIFEPVLDLSIQTRKGTFQPHIWSPPVLQGFSF